VTVSEDRDKRRVVLERYFAAQAAFTDSLNALDDDAGAGRFRETRHRVSALREEYRRMVPVVRLSRCPHTGMVVSHSIDPWGLDGPWWNYRAFVRPPERLPSTYFALSGAVALDLARVERTPFVVRPGPGQPYVLPRILAHDAIKAVVSTIDVGPHRAYPILYFADPMILDLGRVNAWATDQYHFVDAEGVLCRASWEPDAADADFELETWIDAGGLLWIAPGDTTLTLRSDIRACPYLRLDGGRAFRRLVDGDVSVDSGDVTPPQPTKGTAR
jgi:hypothetical protein